jgi:hypothetical protein
MSQGSSQQLPQGDLIPPKSEQSERDDDTLETSTPEEEPVGSDDADADARAAGGERR